MLIKNYRWLAIGTLLFALTSTAFSANVWLTDKQFQNRGVGEFLGTILSVQISSSSETFESGTVQLQVNKVIAGTLTAATVTFEYQRALLPPDSPSNWDFAVPYGSSLTTAIGNEFLVYFNESGGSYSIYPASNAVQPVKSGLLVGTIESVHRGHGDSYRNRDNAVDVEIRVNETVYGWVSGTTVTLPFSKHLLKGWGESRRESDFEPISPMLNSFSTIRDPDASTTADMLDQNYCDSNHGKQFIIAFTNGRITGLMIAKKSLLDAIQAMDTE